MKDIQNEIGDASLQPYPFTSEQTTWFNFFVILFDFTTDKNVKYTAALLEDVPRHAKEYEFSFYPKGGNFKDIVNKGELFKVMSTIVAILKDGINQLNDRGGWNKIKYYPSKSFKGDERRANLYQSYIAKNLPSNIKVSRGTNGVAFINLNPPQPKEMKDIQKIKEFFSKPLDEVQEKYYVEPSKKGFSVLRNGNEITSFDTEEEAKQHADKLNKMKFLSKGKFNEAKSEDSYEVVWTDRDYKKHSKVFKNDPKGAPDNAKKKAEAFKKSLEDKDKKSKEGLYRSIDLNEANGFTSGKQFINIKLKNYPKAVAKVNQLINMIGEDRFTMEMAEWVWDFFNNASFESPVNEAKEEDKVDTITMDIPLFLRMLEYSREDASQDMDLHDVTEKANALGKEKGILSMEDYDAIVGAAEEIGEATDYMKRRKAMDDYFVSKKDKPKKSYNPTPSGKTDYMKRREKDLAEAILAKLKK